MIIDFLPEKQSHWRAGRLPKAVAPPPEIDSGPAHRHGENTGKPGFAGCVPWLAQNRFRFRRKPVSNDAFAWKRSTCYAVASRWTVPGAGCSRTPLLVTSLNSSLRSTGL